MARKLARIATWIVLALYGSMIGVEQVAVSVFLTDAWFLLVYNCNDPLRQGILNCLFPLFAGLGSLLTALMASWKPRPKAVFVVTNLIWLVAHILGCFVTTLWCLVLTRSLKGLALGVISSTIPSYVKRTYPRKGATRLLSAVQSAVPFGIFLMSLSASQLRWYLQFNAQWLLVGALLSFSALLCPLIEAPQTVPGSSLDGARRYIVPLVKRSPLDHNYKRLSVGAASITQAGIQLTGINIIIYYIGPICQMTGLSKNDSMWVMLGLYAFSFLATAGSVCFADSASHTTKMKYGLLLLGLIHGLIFDCMAAYFPEIVEGVLVWRVHPAAAGSVLALCFLFTAVFSVTISGPAAVFTAEVVPSEYRECGVAIAIACGWLSTTAVACLGPLALTYMGLASFLALCVTCCIMSIGVVALCGAYTTIYGDAIASTGGKRLV